MNKLLISIFSFAIISCSAGEEKNAYTDDKYFKQQLLWHKLNEHILKEYPRKQRIDINKIDKKYKSVIEKIGVKKIWVESAEPPKQVTYHVSYSGIVVSGETIAIRYSEKKLKPLVGNVRSERASGNMEIVIVQKLEDSWYLESIKN